MIQFSGNAMAVREAAVGSDAEGFLERRGDAIFSQVLKSLPERV